MVYNFNLGIGWASSGVEFAQSYRNQAFLTQGIDAKFVFVDMFPKENMVHMTRNMGFRDQDVIWLYSYFTNFHNAPTTYERETFEQTFVRDDYTYSREGKIGRYVFSKEDFYTAYFTTESSEQIHRVEYVSQGKLIRKDYFTYGRLYTEYYAPHQGSAHLYQRRFYHEDGSVAYEEIIDGDDVMYCFPDQMLYSKEELVAYMVQRMHFQKGDVVLIDRSTGIGQSIIENKGDARLGVVIHADHYSKNHANRNYILWNNYYEYTFEMHRHVDFYIVATELQKQTMEMQFRKYIGTVPKIYTIPVGSLDQLRYPDRAHPRQPYTMLTASRLAMEKHVDWAIKACVRAKAQLPKLQFHIYGEGGEKQKLAKLIQELDATEYITLKGQQDLTEVYQTYELYLSASTSEGFGLSLLEAIGGGDAIIGFDVMYGNPTFVQDGENGYLIEEDTEMPEMQRIEAMSDAMIKYFKEANREAFHEASYRVARQYLTSEVSALWKDLVQ